MRRADLTSEELTELFIHGFKPVDAKKRKALWEKLANASADKATSVVMLRSFEEMLDSGDKIWMSLTDRMVALLVQCTIDQFSTMYEEDAWTWRIYLVKDGKINLKIGDARHALLLNPADAMKARLELLRKLLESMRREEVV